MTVMVGEKIPYSRIKMVIKGEIVEKDMAEVFGGKKVAIFGIPGAFTPVCTQSHLPGYLSKYDRLKDKGVDHVICLAVNDVFVLKEWADRTESSAKIQFIADGNGDLVKALGLDMDATAFTMGIRSKRFSLYIVDGVVMVVKVEPIPGGCTVSSADEFLSSL